MKPALRLEVVHADNIAPDLMMDVHALCNRAYEEDLEPYFKTFTDATHVLGTLDGVLVSHAMWVTRWLQPGDGPRLRTAYVEMVATAPEFEQRGFATAVMHRLMEAISGFDLAALCPAETGVYARLGWVYWWGPLFIHTDEALMPTPDERVMILRLPKTPALDLNLPLAAEWRAGELW